MRKYILLTLIAFLSSFQLMDAIPARPGKITVTQPDGTRLTLERRGDEWAHWYVDASGRKLRRDEDGFYREMTDAEVSEMSSHAAMRRSARRNTLAQRASRARQNPVVGQRHFLVILVEFDDLEFKEDNDSLAFVNKMNLPGYSRNGATGSARDFYYDNSHGHFEPVFDVFGPVKMTEKYSYYGKNIGNSDKCPEQAVAEGCRLLDDEVDFSLYDNDGDGKVDLVFMYYAGYGEASGGAPDTIWPHQWELTAAGVDLVLDGVRIDSYACSNELFQDEMDGIGPACHEFGHAMGLPDFYDTDDYGSSGLAGGLYSYSVMDGGSYNNESRTPPYFNFEERMLLGWLDESDYLEFTKTGVYTIPPIIENVAYKTVTDMEGEYFVYENRSPIGWDTYLPAHGMIVYHVDKSSRQVGFSTAHDLWEYWMDTNSINARGSHPCFYVIPAASQSSLNYFFEARMPFPYQDVNSYVPNSWNGVEGYVSFSQIAHSDNLVTLQAHVFSGDLDFVSIADAGTYHAGDRFTFELVLPEGVEAPSSVAWYYDDEPAGADSVTLTAGAHVIDARLTYADGRQGTLTLEITVN